MMECGCIVERLIYPRFRASIDCERPVKEITNIHFLDECGPDLIKEVMSKASVYLLRHEQKLNPGFDSGSFI